MARDDGEGGERMNVKGSPFNYTGNKRKHVSVVKHHLPYNYHGLKVLDAFAGGGDLSLHFHFQKLTLNEGISPLANLHKVFQGSVLEDGYSPDDVVDEIKFFCKHYNLNREDKESYLKLREDYNATRNPLLLFVLICHSNSNYMRFNNAGNFNVPFGKRTFNLNMELKLKEYCENLVRFGDNLCVVNGDYKDLRFSDYDLVLLDPPYLGSDAPYNKVWSERDEYFLHEKVSNYCKSGGKFLMTNTLVCNGKRNDILASWIKGEGWNVHSVNHDYKGCNYQRKNDETNEVIITNYQSHQEKFMIEELEKEQPYWEVVGFASEVEYIGWLDFQRYENDEEFDNYKDEEML